MDVVLPAVVGGADDPRGPLSRRRFDDGVVVAGVSELFARDALCLERRADRLLAVAEPNRRHRDAGESADALGDAAVHQSVDTLAAVGAHHDEVGATRVGEVGDGLRGLSDDDCRLDVDAAFFGAFDHVREGAFAPRLRAFAVAVAVGVHGRSGDVQRVNRRADRVREANRVTRRVH